MSYTCLTCGRAYASTYALEQHILTAPNHPHCKTCKQTFRDERGLEQHVQKLHPFHYCADCQGRFPSGQALLEHMRRCHNLTRMASTPLGYAISPSSQARASPSIQEGGSSSSRSSTPSSVSYPYSVGASAGQQWSPGHQASPQRDVRYTGFACPKCGRPLPRPGSPVANKMKVCPHCKHKI